MASADPRRDARPAAGATAGSAGAAGAASGAATLPGAATASAPGPRARRVDRLLAAGTAVVSLGLLAGLPPLDRLDPDGLGAVYPEPFGLVWTLLAICLLGQSVLLLAAHRVPRLTLLLVAALPVPVAAIAVSTLHGLSALPIVVAVVLAVFRVPLARLWPTLVGAAALVAVSQGIVFFVGYGAGRADVSQGLLASAGQGVLQAVGAVGIPLVVALLIRSRREVRAARDDERTALGREQTALGREQDALVDAAVSRERAAMARELHDIAAHHLSGIALMSAVIDRQIDVDPERAHEGARQVREQSTAVLDDLRRLVGLLRDDTPAERAVETVAGIVDLVERARFRMDVTLEVLPGDRTPGGATAEPGGGTPGGATAEPGGIAVGVGPLAQLAAYRTVQEALANAVLHAPAAPCTVTIDDRDAGHLTIRVENPGSTAPAVESSPSGGNGLRGMRERADLVGARLDVGPTDAGGWRVELTLPREAAGASAGWTPDAAPAATSDAAPEPTGEAASTRPGLDATDSVTGADPAGSTRASSGSADGDGVVA
ncbi:sensor histidine kinase [Frigoribacterium sp. 2-23]|uniref:sensor histidine kinase n=1 Tax=Frigoribacterium sp. 2-23 TaxID=3415006 RepID=UPI003C70081D